MDAASILEKLIDTRSGSSDIIAPYQLKKWLPKNVSATSLQVLSQYLQDDRNAVIEEVKENIKQEFNVPVEDIITKEQENEADAIEKLVKDLTNLEDALSFHDLSMDREIDQCTTDIHKLTAVVKGLTDRSSKLKSIDHESMTESIETLGQLIDGSPKTD